MLQTVACEKSYQREMMYNDHPKLVIPIPDEAVGRIIGTSGANLRNLAQRFGVSLAVSSKDNFIPGTRLDTASQHTASSVFLSSGFGHGLPAN